jgi:hypothetical protein
VASLRYWRGIPAPSRSRDRKTPALLRALQYEKPCVLLIDELDKVDHAFETNLTLSRFRTYDLRIGGSVSGRHCTLAGCLSRENQELPVAACAKTGSLSAKLQVRRSMQIVREGLRAPVRS